MIRDLLQSQPEKSAAADICIVGAGAAGIVLAVDLARRGKTVLLLEGGGSEIEAASQDTYRSKLTGLSHRGIHIGRFRAHGGTTTRWGGQVLELDQENFERRPWIAESGWPFPKSELTRFYERALEYEGLANVTRKDEDVWREIKVTPPAFSGFEAYFSRWCPEPNFARLYRKAIEDDPGITLWLHANAIEPLLEGDVMRGLRCRTLSGVDAKFGAGQFIFCLGGIESSRFFLQPREGGHPWNRSGLLGKHFQDHIDCDAGAVELKDPKSFHRIFDNVFSRGFKYHPKLRLSPAEQESRGTLNVAGTMAFASDGDEAAEHFKSTAKHLLRGRVSEAGAGDIAFTGSHLPLVLRQVYRYKLQKRAYNPPGARITLRVHCEQEPTSKSSITLCGERDSLGLLRTSLDWRISDRELDTIQQYVQVAAKSLAGVVRTAPDADLLASSADFLSRCDDSNHHMGGMRMSSSPEDGVVDPNLRLHGIRNAYVCSSAVFPTSGFSNPTHTVLALALRLAEYLG